MLDFTLEENVLMLEILNLSPTYLNYLQNQQQNAYNILGVAFSDRVRVILDEYIVLDENEASASATKKSGLKKADVLEWFAPGESKNQISVDRLYRIKCKLSSILNIDTNVGSESKFGSMAGLTPIYKS